MAFLIHISTNLLSNNSFHSVRHTYLSNSSHSISGVRVRANSLSGAYQSCPDLVSRNKEIKWHSPLCPGTIILQRDVVLTDTDIQILKKVYVPSHILAVLVVTDEEDCSIKDRGLFDTPEWQSGPKYDPEIPGSGHLNTACNFPEENGSDFLYEQT